MVFILDIWALRFVAKCRKTFGHEVFLLGLLSFTDFRIFPSHFLFGKQSSDWLSRPPPKRPKLCLVRVLTRLCLRLFYGFRSGFLALFLEAKQATKN